MSSLAKVTDLLRARVRLVGTYAQHVPTYSKRMRDHLQVVVSQHTTLRQHDTSPGNLLKMFPNGIPEFSVFCEGNFET